MLFLALVCMVWVLTGCGGGGMGSGFGIGTGEGGAGEEELVSVWGWSLIVGSGWVLVWIGEIPEELLSELIWSPLGIDECSFPVDGAELDEEDIDVKFW